MTWINLIGKDIEIIESSNHLLLGVKGTVIDETKNIINIKGKREIKVAKDSVNLLVNGKIVYGKEIKLRPLDRVSRR
ncbi:MAG: ribonuclease P protein subunit [Thermoplasmata archaeon]